MDTLKESLRRCLDADLDYRGRIDQIPLGIDIEKFQTIDKESARRELNLPRKDRIILSVSRLSVYTKMDLFPLLNAFRYVRDRIKPRKVLLILAGGDELNYVPVLEDTAEKLGVRESVIFMKDFSETVKAHLFAASDMFVSPSDNLQETFGLSVLEAMASGRPVVVSDLDGYKDLVVHGETGFRVPTYWFGGHEDLSTLTPLLFRPNYHLYYAQSIAVDVGKMVQYILTLLNNDNLREEMGQKGLDRARSMFSWSTIIMRYERLWHELSLIAQRDDTDSEVEDPYRIDYFRVFKHYVTNLIGPEYSVKTTPLGNSILTGEFVFTICQDMINMIDGGLVTTIISVSKSSIHIGDLVSLVTRNGKYTEDEAYYHVMWMLKQGMIEFTTPQP